MLERIPDGVLPPNREARLKVLLSSTGDLLLVHTEGKVAGDPTKEKGDTGRPGIGWTCLG